MQIVSAGAAKTRHKRTPNFPIAGTMKPFGLYPIFAHPVLPGETIDSLRMKWRVLSKPIKHPLAGAWLETWLCYVKFTDIDRNLGNMFISDTFATTGYTAAANAPRYFTKLGQIDWIRLITERVAKAFFIHDDEALTFLDGVPQVKLNNNGWHQNLMFKPAGVDATKLPSDPTAQMAGFQIMEMMNMSELTYESYLKQYGVQSVVTGIGEPEILRYTRSWTLPVNTVEPTTGVPSSAWVFSDEVSMDKAKRFDEPGFLVMLASVRPKMYLGGLPYSFVGNLWGFSDWFPAYNLDDPAAGVRAIDSTDPVFGAITTGGPFTMLYDHRDLLNHGEQFINSATHPYPLPTANGMAIGLGNSQSKLQGEYAGVADIDAMFVSAVAGDRFAYYEGMANCVINGHMRDTTVAR